MQFPYPEPVLESIQRAQSVWLSSLESYPFTNMGRMSACLALVQQWGQEMQLSAEVLIRAQIHICQTHHDYWLGKSLQSPVVSDIAENLARDAFIVHDFMLHYEAFRKLWPIEQRNHPGNMLHLHGGLTIPHVSQKYGYQCQLNAQDFVARYQQPLPYAHLERGVPRRGAQTFFRINYRSHLNLSAIADNKANIMISINAILISVIISMLTYRNVTEARPMLLMPVVIFLITGLCSLIAAVLSIRPKVSRLLDSESSFELQKRNPIFFGSFVRMSEDAYEAAMNEMLKDGALLYGNMARDLYQLGKVLEQKYRYLTIAYNIFMLGFVATVVTFLLAMSF